MEKLLPHHFLPTLELKRGICYGVLVTIGKMQQPLQLIGGRCGFDHELLFDAPSLPRLIKDKSVLRIEQMHLGR